MECPIPSPINRGNLTICPCAASQEQVALGQQVKKLRRGPGHGGVPRDPRHIDDLAVHERRHLEKPYEGIQAAHLDSLFIDETQNVPEIGRVLKLLPMSLAELAPGATELGARLEHGMIYGGYLEVLETADPVKKQRLLRHKRLVYDQVPFGAWFWRTYDQQEIDHVEEREGGLSGYEFQGSPATKVRLPKLWIETYAPKATGIITPENVRDFLLSSPSQTVSG